jgi:hypothetical protein
MPADSVQMNLIRRYARVLREQQTEFRGPRIGARAARRAARRDATEQAAQRALQDAQSADAPTPRA